MQKQAPIHRCPLLDQELPENRRYECISSCESNLIGICVVRLGLGNVFPSVLQHRYECASSSIRLPTTQNVHSSVLVLLSPVTLVGKQSLQGLTHPTTATVHVSTQCAISNPNIFFLQGVTTLKWLLHPLYVVSMYN